jgi:hypothetical protein
MKYFYELNPGQKIVILYINDFLWKDEKYLGVFNGSPESKRVYLAMFDTASDGYYLKVDVPTDHPEQTLRAVKGIRVPKLTFTCPEYQINAVEVNESNVIDLEISDDDYGHIKTWMESEFAEFRAATETNISTVIPDPENLPEAEFGEDQSAYDEMDNLVPLDEDRERRVVEAIMASLENMGKVAATNIETINGQDPQIAEELNLFMEMYIKKMKGDHPSMIDYPREFSLDEDYGKGANLYNVAFHLHKYSHPTKGYGDVKEDLFAIIYYTLLELSRRRLHGA